MDGDLEVKFARLEERQDHIIKKLDEGRADRKEIFAKLDKLPCEAQNQKIKNINGKTNSNAKWIYCIVAAIIGMAFFIFREVLAK